MNEEAGRCAPARSEGRPLVAPQSKNSILERDQVNPRVNRRVNRPANRQMSLYLSLQDRRNLPRRAWSNADDLECEIWLNPARLSA